MSVGLTLVVSALVVAVALGTADVERRLWARSVFWFALSFALALAARIVIVRRPE